MMGEQSAFDVALWLLLLAAAVPGVVVMNAVALPRILPRLARRRPEKPLPSRWLLTLAGTVQTLSLVAGLAAVGVWLAPRVGLGAAVFAAVLRGEGVWAALAPQLVAALTWGLGGAALFLALYYGVFRGWIDPESRRTIEQMRLGLGLATRILYGGVVEEILARWGLMTFFAWLFGLATGQVGPLVMWLAIVASGLLFAAGHLPAYVAAGMKRTAATMSAMLLLNLLASAVFGWLFWRFGLTAAVVAHALFHALWHPLDLRLAPNRA